jgi:hypothetical protein
MPDTKPKPDDPAQSQRFIDMAREVEVDENAEAMGRTLERIIKGDRVTPLGSHPRRSEKPTSS